MSSDGAGAVSTDQLSQQVDAIERDCQALATALKKNRSTKLCLLIAIVVVLCVVGAMFYQLGNRYRQPETIDELMAFTQSELESRTKTFTGEVQKLVSNTSPTLTKALYDQSKKDMPKYMAAIGTEREQLVENLQKRMAEQLKQRHHEVLAQYEDILADEFPQAKDEELRRRMMANVQLSVDRLVQKYYIDELREQLLAMYQTWDNFPIADSPAEGEPALEDQLVADVLEVFTQKIVESRAATPR